MNEDATKMAADDADGLILNRSISATTNNTRTKQEFITSGSPKC